MKRAALIGACGAALGIAALQAAPALRNAAAPQSKQAEPKQVEPGPSSAGPPSPAPRPAQKPVAQAFNPTGKTTPMAERVAVVGLLNKRNGLWRDLVMKPGEARRIGDVVVRLRACESTAPWEAERLTGAFVQVLVNDPDKKWRRYFSGWLYKESPSLNVVEHPVYDVWTKECRMKHPDVGPNTTVVRGGDTPKARAPESADNET